MAVDHRIIRNSENFKGLDKRTSDLKRSMEFATDIKNAAYRVSGAINKRKGFKSKSITSDGIFGSTTFKKVNQTSGAIEDELIIVNKNVQKVIENDLTFINNTENENIYFNIIADSNEIKLNLLDAGNILTTINLDTGLAAGDKTLAQVKTDLDALSRSTLIWKKGTNNITLNRIPSGSNFEYKVTVPASNVIAQRYSRDVATNGVGMDIIFGNEEFTFNVASNVGLVYSTGVVSPITYLDALGWDTITDPTNHTFVWQQDIRGQGDGTNDFPSFTIADNASLDGLETATQSIKAALLDLTPSLPILKASENTIVKYKTIVDVPRGDSAVTELLNGYKSGASSSVLASEELENATFAQLNDVLYISNGIDSVLKYDGTRVYKAGLPNAPAITSVVASGSGTSKTASKDYDYMFQYEFTDAVGNIITSVKSATKTYNSTGTQDATITLPAFPEAGFDFVSTNLKIKIYRTKEYTSGNPAGQFYHLTTLNTTVNDSTSTYTILDDVTDGAINEFLAFVEPIKRHDPPPVGKYLSVFKECLIVAGQNTNVNNLQFSLPFNAVSGEIGAEYFPNDDNAIIVNSSFGDSITAIAPLRDLLYIFHKNSINVLAGDISSPVGAPFTVDLLTKEGGVGCQSQSSITEFRNQLVFLSDTGFYIIDSSAALNELSAVIKPLFLDNALKKKRAISFNWTEENVLIMIIPKESTGSNSDIYTLNTSLVVAYDYFKNAWLQWDNLDFSGGASLFKNQLYIMSRQDSLSTISSMNNTATTFDYIDHATPINFEYDTNWESLAEPTVPKKFLRLKVFSQDTDLTFESPSFDIDLKIQKDYLPTDLGTIKLDFGALAGGGWGNSKWGEFPWGNVSGRGVKTKLPAGKSKCIKLRFTNNTENENVLITNYEFEVATPFRVEIKE